jgi:hypothetical protein
MSWYPVHHYCISFTLAEWSIDFKCFKQLMRKLNFILIIYNYVLVWLGWLGMRHPYVASDDWTLHSWPICSVGYFARVACRSYWITPIFIIECIIIPVYILLCMWPIYQYHIYSDWEHEIMLNALCNAQDCFGILEHRIYHSVLIIAMVK